MDKVKIIIEVDEHEDDDLVIINTRGLKKVGCKELLMKFYGRMMDLDVATNIMTDIADQIIENNERYACGLSHLIDSVGRLEHVFHLKSTVYRGQNMQK